MEFMIQNSLLKTNWKILILGILFFRIWMANNEYSAKVNFEDDSEIEKQLLNWMDL